MISWGMMINHSAHQWNPMWGFVSGARNFLSVISLMGLGYFLFVSLQHKKKVRREQVEQEVAAEIRRVKNLRESEEYRRRKELADEQDRIKKEKEEIQREKTHQERLRQEALEKQNRSARDANRAALDDF